MSASDDLADNVLRQGEFGEPMLRAMFKAVQSMAVLRERQSYADLCGERFARFFRVDGKSPEWSTFPDGLHGKMEWVGIDQMPKGRVRRIVRSLKSLGCHDDIEDDASLVNLLLAGDDMRDMLRCRAFERFMDTPRCRPDDILGPGFKGCGLWADAVALVFERELERRRAQGVHW